MIRIDKELLAIINTYEKKDSVSFEDIIEVLQSHPSNTIYFTSKGVIYGLITLGDIYRSDKVLKQVLINKEFSSVQENGYMKARELFRSKVGINSLPIVNDMGEMLGEYSRYDEILSYYRQPLFDEYCIRELKKQSGKIAFFVSEGIRLKSDILNNILAELKLHGISADIVTEKNFLEACDRYFNVFFLDRNDCYGMAALKSLKTNSRLTGNMLVLDEFIKECGVNHLQHLAESGVYVLNLFTDESSKFIVELNQQISVNGHQSGFDGDFAKMFLSDLFSEEYRLEVLSTERFENRIINGIAIPADFNSKYKNFRNGERVTTSQPENPGRTIYMFGPCFFRGIYVEDKNTIASVLQKKLNEVGENVKVVNYGDCDIDYNHFRRINKTYNEHIKAGDIVVTYFSNRRIRGVENLDLSSVFEEKKVEPCWFKDNLEHFNHIISKIWGETIFNYIHCRCGLQKGNIDKGKEKIEDSILDRYMKGKNIDKYSNVGSIVMNCNPFTNGHRYLIEQAKRKCDALIIFVVHEDKSFFSFNERFSMVIEGTKDMEDVFVVPSGDRILSQETFPEYFIKIVDEDLKVNAENDIRIFAEDIAPKYGIKTRFVGEEKNDVVTSCYNDAMKKVLPKYGIKLEEIPRKEAFGKAISATSVRDALTNNNYEILDKLIPGTTEKILFFSIINEN